MSRTNNLRRQHDKLEELASDFLSEITRASGGGDPYSISMKLARMIGHLKVHLAQEDRSLYPAMMASSDDRTARTAKRFAEEMGGLARDVEDFVARYSCSRAISADFPVFRHDAHRLVGKLAERIKRENDSLYPLADAMTGIGDDRAA